MQSLKIRSVEPSRMAPGISRSLAVTSDIPEDVMCENIFSRLPFKLLAGLRTMSRHCCQQLTNNSQFAAKQARLCPSCPALIQISATVNADGYHNYYLNVNSSMPATVGVPSSRLDFLRCGIHNGASFRLLASTNGLLCIRYIPNIHPQVETILIANPATQQAQQVPSLDQYLYQSRAVGLAFDPPSEELVNEHKFTIVQATPVRRTNDTSIDFRFDIFSSDRGLWVESNTTVNAKIKLLVRCNKVVYANGVLYFDYKDYLLWFGVSSSAGGIIKMPWEVSKSEYWEHHSIDTSINGTLLCTNISKDGFIIYQLVEGSVHHWELKHKKEWIDIMKMNGDAFQFCHSMKLRNGWQSKFCERWLVRPLGLESERWLYLQVSRNGNTLEKMLRYDLGSGKMEALGTGMCNPFNFSPVFGYRNSMAALPPIAAPPLQG